MDHSTLSVLWEGQTCQLGYTVLFKLVDRLSRRPNQFVTFDQLLHDVWNGDSRSPDTIRSAVRNLRQKLTDAGMNRLAAAIQGQAGRYGLILNNGD
ncbi:MAG: helix-turn-helix domain-containing protein [Planctomycetes bacterium]|nr:helix-turn-helix domain-containing protein [Planctomycetota bacterium]